MRKSSLLMLVIAVGLGEGNPPLRAQKSAPDVTTIHVHVNMVQLNVAVTDKKGHYVTGLTPKDFEVYEDGIREKIASFGDQGMTAENVEQIRPEDYNPSLLKPQSSIIPALEGAGSLSAASGASIFILFDTSNYMYRQFVFAQNAIAEFVQTLNPSDQVAIYSYSRDFFRACPLTANRPKVLEAVRRSVAGDDAALYNALLWTLRDAANFSGRRAVVVFSNGPDDASVVSPEDVRELAQSEGVPIYMISTRAAELDPLSTAVFRRIASSTGGIAYFARAWQDQQKAFGAIRNDLAHLYDLSYYPLPNPNLGWRRINVRLVGNDLQKYHVRTRSGYRPMVRGVSALNGP